MEVADPRNTYHPSERGWNYWNLITWEPDFVSWLTLVSLRSRKWWSLFCKFWKHWNLDSVFSMGQNQRRQWHPTPVLLPGKSHGWRSLVGGSPWGLEESDTTELLHFHFSLSCIGEGNGNPLQCSCLENPRDGGAWGAAVYRVAQSQTRLTWLSSKKKNAVEEEKQVYC